MRNDYDQYDGYCEHGTYVGGCGIDWMCGYCEEGISWQDYLAICMSNRIHYRVQREVMKMQFMVFGLKAGMPVEDIAQIIRNNVQV